MANFTSTEIGGGPRFQDTHSIAGDSEHHLARAIRLRLVRCPSRIERNTQTQRLLPDGPLRPLEPAGDLSGRCLFLSQRLELLDIFRGPSAAFDCSFLGWHRESPTPQGNNK